MSSATIAAVATAHGTGGVAVIRVSGEDAAKICDKIFKGKNKLSESVPYMMQYGKIIYDGKLIDKVLAVYMKAPHSFTGENTVEINCHGGVLVTQKVLEAVILSGARYAMPGEFTKRAFLNGRMDLSSAEAVADIIDAETAEAARNAAGQLAGAVSRRIDDIYNVLTDISSHYHAVLDYPDEDIEPFELEDYRRTLREGEQALTALLATWRRGALVKNGCMACSMSAMPRPLSVIVAVNTSPSMLQSMRTVPPFCE